jgi:hypothetical protein
MGIGGRGYGDELVAVLSAATTALADLPASVHRLTGPDLDALLPVVDRLAAVAAAGRFTITTDAVARGEVTASQAGSTAQWVADRCPSLDGRDAALVAKAVRELASADLAGARAAVAEGRLSVPAGCVVASELRQLTPLIDPDAVDAVAAGLVAMGQVDGTSGVRRVRPALLARYGLGLRLQDIEDRHRGLTVLSCGHDIGGGITEYRLRLAPEARAVVEAALNTTSQPQPTDREPDPRTIDQRRGDALVHLCRRAITLTQARNRSATTTHTHDTGTRTDTNADVMPTDVTPTHVMAAVRPTGTKATIIVTIALADLRDRTRPGVLVGGLDAGTLLGPDTIRRLACDSTVVPAVLATDGHPLHWGRHRRYFTTAQTTALWLRDRHCTFPGCAVPATWCDAHHLQHWLDGGPTDLTNAALLCQRHHTIAHRDRLHATLTTTTNTTNTTTDTGTGTDTSTSTENDTSNDTSTATGGHPRVTVVWDRTPGSYDHALARGPSPGDPPPGGLPLGGHHVEGPEP